MFLGYWGTIVKYFPHTCILMVLNAITMDYTSLDILLSIVFYIIEYLYVINNNDFAAVIQ